MPDKKATEIWEKTWTPETHTTDYALKRIKSANSAKLTPIKIDSTDYYGYFQGQHGRYETFLDYCPCGDFHRSKLPCKHIYRLAIEFDLIDNTNVENNINAVLTPKKERATLDETINLVESLSENAQHELLHIAANIRSTTPTYKTYLNTNTLELINSGIIVDAYPGKYEINIERKRKSEIMELLDNENILYDKKLKKSILQEICIEQIPDKAVEKFGKYIFVSIPTKYKPLKIHYYLHRKYGYLGCLPDDDITDQLIKRGYYTRTQKDS